MKIGDHRPMKAQDHLNQLELWDQLIKEGQIQLVRKQCRKLNHKRIPRNLLLDYAQIARRVGAPDLIVFWYNPLIRTDRLLEIGATTAEKAIYALGLLRLGSFQEAFEILNTLDPRDDYQIYFYRASLFIEQWNYKKAIPQLRKYIHDQRTPAYSKLVGRLNLCASLVALGRLKIARVEIDQLMKTLQRASAHQRIIGNLFEIQAQLHFLLKNYTAALNDLETASTHLKYDEKSLLFVHKWRAFIGLQSAEISDENISAVRRVRSQAEALKDWQTVRECDLQIALTQKNPELLQLVFWGTFFPAYKSRILELVRFPMNVGDNFVWRRSMNSMGSVPINLYKCPSPALRHLFHALTKELYRPLRLNELFGAVYPQEYFNPRTGPAKLHRLIGRARQWLRHMGYPIEITSFGNSFRLNVPDGVSLFLSKDLPEQAPPNIPPSLSGRGRFTAAEFAAASGLSPRTARRRLIQLIDCGQLLALRRGPRTQYITKAPSAQGRSLQAAVDKSTKISG